MDSSNSDTLLCNENIKSQETSGTLNKNQSLGNSNQNSQINIVGPNNNDKNGIRQSSTDRESVPVKPPRYTYLKNIDNSDYFFETNKNIPCIFWTFLAFTIVSTVVLIVVDLKVAAKIILILLLLIVLALISIFPYGLTIHLIIDTEELEIKKKRIAYFIHIFADNKYKLFDVKEFVLNQEIINSSIIGFKLDMILMDSNLITLVEKWGFNNEKEEMEKITQKLNSFLGDNRNTISSMKNMMAENNTGSNNNISNEVKGNEMNNGSAMHLNKIEEESKEESDSNNNNSNNKLI